MNPIEWSQSAEHIFKRAAGYGVVIFTISAFVYATFELGFIEREAIDGYPFAIVRLLMGISAGLLVVGLVTSVINVIASFIKYVVSIFKKRKSDRELRKKLHENIDLIADETKLILYGYMKCPSGRFISPGDTLAIRQLVRAELIASENGQVIRSKQEHMRVNSLILTEEGFELVASRIEEKFPKSSSTQEAWEHYYDRIHYSYKVTP